MCDMDNEETCDFMLGCYEVDHLISNLTRYTTKTGDVLISYDQIKFLLDGLKEKHWSELYV